MIVLELKYDLKKDIDNLSMIDDGRLDTSERHKIVKRILNYYGIER